jgi:hypothetical protein
VSTRKISVTLTEEQYRFAKQWGRLWLRDVIQSLMDSGYDGEIPERIVRRPWWRFWR